ncbi:hypothetical protein [Vulcanisaeta distributa]|uniref:hypothetical protein n=1 Tax=Vulcanisaeta distributa TaxID=164451 RepID=UPI000AC5FC6C|nr:hypothetical protein [Vulcanisaeta distributa]
MRIADVITYVAKAYVGKPVTGFRGGFYEDVASKISHGFTAVYVKVVTDEGGLVGWGG